MCFASVRTVCCASLKLQYPSYFIRHFVTFVDVLIRNRYAPPGGQTSISLGDYVKPPAPQTPMAKAVVVPANGAASLSRSSPLKASPSSASRAAAAMSAIGLRVGVAVCEAAGLKAATLSALQRLGEQMTMLL